MQQFYSDYYIFSYLDIGKADKINAREKGRIALYACRDSLQSKSQRAYKEEYSKRVREVLTMPTVSKILSHICYYSEMPLSASLWIEGKHNSDYNAMH